LTTGLIAIVVIALVWYFGGSIKQSVHDRNTDRKVEKLEREADKLIIESHKTAGAREAENSHRETEIKPALEGARQNRRIARTATQKAEKDYETSITQDIRADTSDLDALHQRNCADYAELYPADYQRRCAQ
jgi:hypothetical protein